MHSCNTKIYPYPFTVSIIFLLSFSVYCHLPLSLLSLTSFLLIRLLSYLFSSNFISSLSLTKTAVNQPTPTSRALLEKLIVTQLVKKFAAFYETRRFIAVFTEPATGPCAILHMKLVGQLTPGRLHIAKLLLTY
jgi:hypothetical protein